jgi:hypothetical protein
LTTNIKRWRRGRPIKSGSTAWKNRLLMKKSRPRSMQDSLRTRNTKNHLRPSKPLPRTLITSSRASPNTKPFVEKQRPRFRPPTITHVKPSTFRSEQKCCLVFQRIPLPFLWSCCRTSLRSEWFHTSDALCLWYR